MAARCISSHLFLCFRADQDPSVRQLYRGAELRLSLLLIQITASRFRGEFNIAKRLGAQDQFDVSVAPFARWTEFPWNRIVYTNVRVGLAGFSYVTSISPFERQNSGNGVGSRILHFLAPEVTFARSETAKGEAFFRVHHRSCVYGLFNGVKGGSNYLCGGYRIFY